MPTIRVKGDKSFIVEFSAEHPDQGGRKVRRRRLFASEEDAAAFLAAQEAYRRFSEELLSVLDHLSGIACAMRPNQNAGQYLRPLHADIRELYALIDRGPYPVEVRKQRRPVIHDRQGFTAKQRIQLIERFGMTCQYCERQSDSVTYDPDGADWQIDHVVPVSKGGKHHRSNWVLACRACNQSKGDLPLRIWEQSSDHLRFARRKG